MSPENTDTPQATASVSPLRVLCGTTLGGLIGFAPGLGVAPGLWVCFVVAFLLFRIPLGVTTGVFVVAKIFALLAAGVCFSVGQLLLDGPLQGMFRVALDTPFIALFGLEYYVVSGGLLLGLILGVVTGIQQNKKHSKAGNPTTGGGLLRPAGIGFAVVGLGALWAVQSTAAEGFLTAAASKGLGHINGATVDVSGVELDLAESRFSISDLAFANPKALKTDLFRGIQLTADLSSASLLTKRLHVERIVISHVDSGLERAVPGVLIGGASEPEVEEPVGDEKSIEDYLEDWEVWSDRLGQAREWLETMSEDTAGSDGETAEERADQFGYRSVVAEHLFTEAPMLLVDEFVVEGMQFSWLDGESFELNAKNLSTQPSLVDGAMSMSFASKSDLFRLALTLPSSRLDQPGELDFSLSDIALDSVTNMLKLGEGNSISGGSFSISLKGPWSGGKTGYIDLPLEVSLNDFTIALSGSNTFNVSNLKLPIHLRGPIDRPNVSVDAEALTQSLMDAGLSELVNFVQAEKERLLGEGKAMLQDELDNRVTGKLNDLLGGDIKINVGDLLEGNLAETQEQLEAAAKAKLESEARDKAAAQLEQLLGDDVGDLKNLLETGSIDEINAEVQAIGQAKLEAGARDAAAAELEKLLGDDAAPMKALLETGTKEEIEAAIGDIAKEQLKEKGGDVLKDKLGETLGDKLKGLGGIFGGKKPD